MGGNTAAKSKSALAVGELQPENSYFNEITQFIHHQF